tara:strand:+ start:5199 stop:5948 length:750 start_codon:yes stop_codon:yes gene_type:complete
MRILLLILLSTFVWSDDHTEMYQDVYAQYQYCSVKDGLSDAQAERMFEKHITAYRELAESLDDEVSTVMLFPFYTNEEMRGGADMMFITHAPNMKAMGEYLVATWNAIDQDKMFPESPMECENASTAFQRVGPSSTDEPSDFFTVDYWPCNYKEGADPQLMRELQAKVAMEHYANGADAAYRYIYPGYGSDRGEGPDFWFSQSSPGLIARGESIDIFWDKTYGSEAERARWDHFSCDKPSTWVGWRAHN